MNLKQLEYFVQVADQRSFTRAAQRLDVAQPALSRQVRLLEVELRQTLLARNGRGVVPTEAGSRLLDHARGILHQVARTYDDLALAHREPAGRVAIGLPPSAAKVLTAPLVRAARERAPQVALSIAEGLSIDMQEWLRLGRLDLALVYNPVPAPEVATEPVLEEALYLVAPRRGFRVAGNRGGAVTLAEVTRLPLVIPSRPNALRMLVEARLAALGRKPAVALEIDGVDAILELVADGAGHAVLPHTSLRGFRRPAALVARPIVRPRLTIPLALARSSQRPVTPAQGALRDLLLRVARDRLEPPRSR